MRTKLFKKVDGFLHGGDYNPDQWLDEPEILQKDIELMKKAHVNFVSLGIFSWAKYEPEEGKYDFDWLIEIMDRLYENGIYTILATPSGARPAWLDEKYPQCRRCDQEGKREYHKDRHNHCMSSEIFRQKVYEIDHRLASKVKGHPGLILWHLSNEYGGYCYCDLCKKKFQNYLRKKFHNDIEKLNHQYWTGFWSKHYNSFEQIDLPYANGESTLMGLLNDFYRFSSENATDFMCFERDIVKAVTPEIDCTTNLMWYFNDYDYYQMSKQLDIVSWDNYPRFHNDQQSSWAVLQEAGFNHSLMRSLKKEKPFLLMESSPSMTNWFAYNKLKRPNMHILASLQAVANGSDSVGYFQWRKSRGSAEQFHGAVVDHNGRDDTRVFKEVSQLGAILEKIKEVSGHLNQAKVAILYDWDNRWAIDLTQGFQKENKKYEATLYDFYQALVKFVGDVDIVSSQSDLGSYPIVIAPMMLMVHEGIGERLKAYVRQGGQLLATYMLGYVNENQLAYLGGFPGDGLRELFGIENMEIDSLYPTDRNEIKTKQNQVIEVFDYCELLSVDQAEVLATYQKDFYQGQPAITMHRYGAGKAYYVASRCQADQLAFIFEQMLQDCKIEALHLPLNVEFHQRGPYRFYLNISERQVVVEAIRGYDLVSEQTIENQLELNPYQVAILKSI